jgi:YegS/Rv2252/BmrU family lipid kinase
VTRRLAVLVNPAAAGGKSLAALPKVEAELQRLGSEYRVVTSDSGEHAKKVAREMAGAGEVVVAVGGDGLVGTLAGALRESGGELAIVPAGRGNDFARVLGIPSKAREAARAAVEGEPRALDVGFVNGGAFVGIASCGLDSDVNRLANETKLIRGNLVYLYATLRSLAGWKPPRFEISVDGERRSFTGYSVAVANSTTYGGGMIAVPMAELDDGKLDVMLIPNWSKLRCVKALAKAFKGAHVDEEGIAFLRGEVVEIAADRPFAVYADGDPLAQLPATVTVERQTLHVIVPR